ncbi:MAG: hypothetical protein ACW986_16725 [Promethearchaeota archaeon]|jgi:hypothetical protein
MSKFFENIKEKVKKIPSLVTRRMVQISLSGDSIEILLSPIMQSYILREYLEDLIIKVNEVIVYDANTYPFDFDVKLNNKMYHNQNLLEIYDRNIGMGVKLGVIVPNRANITAGYHTIEIASHKTGTKAKFEKYIPLSSIKSLATVSPQRTKVESKQCAYCGKRSSDPNQVICEYCGSELG